MPGIFIDMETSSSRDRGITKRDLICCSSTKKTRKYSNNQFLALDGMEFKEFVARKPYC
jgi:hypothetical protein